LAKIVRTGVAFREETLKMLNEYMDKTGMKNRSRIIDEALRLYLSDRGIMMEEGMFGGVIAVYFEHEAEQKLTELQHEFLDIVISNTHVHLDAENCMEAILVKGDIRKIKEFMLKIEGVKGLKAMRSSFFKIM
jgi:CopG family nickel-responsive transcriptional regulator